MDKKEAYERMVPVRKKWREEYAHCLQGISHDASVAYAYVDASVAYAYVLEDYIIALGGSIHYEHRPRNKFYSG